MSSPIRLRNSSIIEFSALKTMESTLRCYWILAHRTDCFQEGRFLMKLQHRIIHRFVPVVIFFFYVSSLSAQSATTPLPVPFGVIGVDNPAGFYVTDIATDSAGDVYTVDPLNSWVKKYAPDGSEQLRIDIARNGWARQISVAPSGDIYVVQHSTPDATIRIYSNAGSLIDVWTLSGGSWGDVFAQTDDRILTTKRGSETKAVVVFDGIGNETFRFGDSGQLTQPFGVATAPDGSIYVTELNIHRVQKFDEFGNPLFVLGGAGDAPGKFRSPRSVGVDSFGDVYVLDRRNERVQKFSPDGDFLFEWGGRGTEPGQFVEPDGITVAPDDTVWVAGYHGHDIQHFDGNGVLLDRWKEESGPGEFGQVRGVAVSDSQIFVVDGWNQSIEVFDTSTGEFLYDFGERDQGEGFNFPRAIDIGPNGDLYITDDGQVMQTKVDGTVVARFKDDDRTTGYRSKGIVVSQDALFETSFRKNRVYKRDGSDGEILEQWGDAGSGPGEFAGPYGIALAPDGTLYVADSGNTRIQRFTEKGEYIGEWATAARPSGIALDPVREILYVGEGNAVEAYDLTGVFLFSWGEKGNQPGQLKGTYGISLSPDGNVIYVSQKKNNRLQRFVFPDAFVEKPTYQPGTDLGLFVWRDPSSVGTWHVRISGDGPSRPYNLEVNSSEDFISAEGFKLWSNDSLSVQGSNLQLTGRISTWQDGVDLVVLDKATLSFEITINGKSENLNIRVGETGMNPGINIFHVQ